MSRQRLAALVVVASALAACADTVGGPEFRATTSATVHANRIPFSGTLYGCAETPPAEQRITDGLVLHFNDAQNQNLWDTGEPLVDGIENNIVDATINLKTGDGVAHARSMLSPTAVSGSWQGTAKVTIGAGGVSVHGVGRGTGELAGMTIHYAIEQLLDGTVNQCNAANGFVATIEGYITQP